MGNVTKLSESRQHVERLIFDAERALGAVYEWLYEHPERLKEFWPDLYDQQEGGRCLINLCNEGVFLPITCASREARKAVEMAIDTLGDKDD